MPNNISNQEIEYIKWQMGTEGKKLQHILEEEFSGVPIHVLRGVDQFANTRYISSAAFDEASLAAQQLLAKSFPNGESFPDGNDEEISDRFYSFTTTPKELAEMRATDPKTRQCLDAVDLCFIYAYLERTLAGTPIHI